MAQLHLPAEHSDADLVLAGQIAEVIDSAELYVTWTPEHGRAIPEVVAELRAAVPQWTSTFGLLLHAARELLAAIVGRNRELSDRPAA